MAISAIGGVNPPFPMSVGERKIDSEPEVVTDQVKPAGDDDVIRSADGRYFRKIRIPQRSIHKRIEAAEDASVKYMVKELDNLLSRNPEFRVMNQEKYDQLKLKIDEHVENSDYRAAEADIRAFFGKAEGGLASDVEQIMEQADKTFWLSIAGSFKVLMLESEADSILDGSEVDRSLRELIQNARGHTEEQAGAPADGGNLEATVELLQENAREGAVDKLKNAGRNRYSEDAASILRHGFDAVREGLTGSIEEMITPLEKMSRGPGLEKELSNGKRLGGIAERYADMRQTFTGSLDEQVGEEAIVELEEVRPEELGVANEAQVAMEQYADELVKMDESLLPENAVGAVEAAEAYVNTQMIDSVIEESEKPEKIDEKV